VVIRVGSSEEEEAVVFSKLETRRWPSALNLQRVLESALGYQVCVCVRECVSVCVCMWWPRVLDLQRALERALSYVCHSVLQCVAVCCSVLQCVAVCCSVVQ